MILVEISLEIEFKIQKITMLLFLIHELRRLRSLPSSLRRDPSMNPSLFFTDRAIVIARLQNA